MRSFSLFVVLVPTHVIHIVMLTGRFLFLCVCVRGVRSATYREREEIVEEFESIIFLRYPREFAFQALPG